MAKAPEYGFWILERKLMRQEFTDTVMNVLLAAGSNGASMLPSNLSVLVDWDVFNERALEWLNMYMGLNPSAAVSQDVFDWVTTLTETQRKGVTREIDDWVRLGAGEEYRAV